MVTVTADCRRVGERTLVECRLTNDREVAAGVRLESRLDGATWPPCDGGHPVRGWADGTWTGRLGAGQTVGVGFASPADPTTPPVRVETFEVDPDETSDDRFGQRPTPDDVTRELTDPRPPLEGLVGGRDGSPSPPTSATTTAEVAATDAWLDDVTRRVERLEALAAARSLPDATVVVADVDGLEGVHALCDATCADRERLLEVARRAERLAGRIETTAVPVETLERLA
jgi:hypothetical protein